MNERVPNGTAEKICLFNRPIRDLNDCRGRGSELPGDSRKSLRDWKRLDFSTYSKIEMRLMNKNCVEMSHLHDYFHPRWD